MRKFKFLSNILQSMLVIVMITLVLLMIQSIKNIQGNARVVNYAGIVRGTTQRLVKLEISNHPNDNLISYIDSILDGLQHGGGEYNLHKIEDIAYLERLGLQIENWQVLKNAIYETRHTGEGNPSILGLSEEYFEYANNTVDAAERYSEGRASQLRILEKVLICIIACILLLMIGHAVYAFVIQRKNIELNIKAYIDSATGLPNRERCNQILQGQGVLSEETGYACIMFDLNNLKIVNDTLGHKEGDILIVQFANILRSVASEKVFIGRYGGDEFVAIIFETNEDVVKSLLIEIEQKVKAYNDSIDGSAISYAVGYEISCVDKGCTLQTLLEKADQKMYINKARIKGLL